MRVLRRDPQGDLLAAAGDPDRDAARLQRQRPDHRPVDLIDLALQRRRPRRPGLLHDLHALVQRPQPLRGRREAVAVGPPFVLVPAGADAHLDPAAGDDVDRRGDLGQVGRVPVGHAGAHLAEPDPAGAGGEGGHQRPGLVGRLVRRHGRGVEVVVDPDRLPRAGFRALREPGHRAPLLGRLDADQVEPPALRDEDPESHRHAANLRGRFGRSITWFRQVPTGQDLRPMWDATRAQT